MRFALAAAILAATVGTTPAAAQFYPPMSQNPRADQDIRWQLDEIYQTIERARRSGRFSGPESRALHYEGQRLYDRFQYMRRDGLDRYEFAELDEGARALRDRIERRLRFGDWRDGRDDGFDNGRPVDAKDWDRQDDAEGWKEDEGWGDQGSDESWERDQPWRDEPSEAPRQREEDWSTAPSQGRQDRDEPATDGASPGTPNEDWWLPPDERESIDTRPGDRPPGSGGDSD